MKIELGRNFYLESDVYDFKITEKKKKLSGKDKGKEYFKDVSYHNTISNALESFRTDCLLKSKAKNFKELKKDINEVESLLKDIRNQLKEDNNEEND